MPTAVILAGVLAVVAFALVIRATVHTDDVPAALPPAKPPALGVPLPPAADQWAVPIPDSSVSLALSPTASPTASPGARPSSAPPSPTAPAVPPPKETSAATSPAPRDTLAIARDDVPQQVDLSAEGGRDWVHWGQQGTFSLERRKDGGFAILEGTPAAPRFRHGLSPERFSWQGGAPVERSTGTPTGIRTCDEGNGFALTAPVDKGTRTLRLYVGVLEARGRLDARLPGGATARATLQSRESSLETAVFTVTYRTDRSGTLALSWVTERSFDDDCGGVALQAATLS